jgi:hypothetical protein
LVTIDIVSGLRIMHTSIQLNYQPCRMAVKINYKTNDYLLAAEVPAAQLVGAQVLPQDALGIRHIMP